MRFCSKCGPTEATFPKTGAVCKPCVAAYKREHYLVNKTRINAKNNNDYYAKREARLKRCREYYQENAEAIKAQVREYTRANKDKISQYHKSYYRENRDELLVTRQIYASGHRDEIEDYRLRAAYGISLAQYEEMLVAQDGRCRICGSDKADSRGRSLHVDHDHATGRVRGLLCNQCNHAIGLLQDSPERFERAADYLRGKL